jgi:two-component system NtrC family sensor kinase
VSHDEHQPGETILDELPFGICVRRAPTGEVLSANRAFRAFMADEGAASEGRTQPLFRDRTGQPYPVERLPFGRALALGTPVTADDLVIHRPDGTRVYLRAFAKPVRDHQGLVSHVVVAMCDITGEVTALAERARAEQRLAVAIQHAPVLLFMLDRDGVLTDADGSLRPGLEGGRSGMVGRSMLAAYADQPRVVDNIRRALAGETVSYSVEVRGVIMDVWLGPLRDPAGERSGAIGVCTDVTESRRLHARLVHDDRVRAMGTVAASVAHEINNPLMYMIPSLQTARGELDRLAAELEALAARHQPGDEAAAARRRLGAVRELLGTTLLGAERIRRITRDLGAFSRRDDEVVDRIELATVARSVLKLVRKEIETRARLVEELEQTPPVLASEARLVQVLVNLLTNAWQALEAPAPDRHVIGLRTTTREGEAVVEVWDSGPGVSPERRENIFAPFVTTKADGAGTGLGLFVCRNIVASLQGRITVEDVPSGGALFRVVLPPAADLLTDARRKP